MKSSHIPFKKISGITFPAALILLGLYFTTCTQGQGPGASLPEKVTSAGTEAPPEDVCEKPENLDNILCQWVATRISSLGSGGSGAMETEIVYDPEGRIRQTISRDAAGTTYAVSDFTYNDYGLWKYQNYSDPVPPDSGNFTKEEERTYHYDTATGALLQIYIERKENGLVKFKTYHTVTPPLGVWIADLDGNNVYIQDIIQTFTKDPANGDITSISEVIAPDPNAALQNWNVTNLTYNFQSGRLETITTNTQDCAVVPASPCARSPTPPNVPHNIGVLEFKFDDQGRIAKMITTSEGEIQNHVSTSMPGVDPVPDQTSECIMSYEINTQAKIAGKHLFEVVMTDLGRKSFKNVFNERDLFSTISCGAGGSVPTNPSVTFKWVRLWEALPEGKQPGS